MFHQICTLEFKAFPHIVEYLYFNDKYPERQSFMRDVSTSRVLDKQIKNKTMNLEKRVNIAFVERDM